MKKIFLLFTLVSVLVSCGKEPERTSSTPENRTNSITTIVHGFNEGSKASYSLPDNQFAWTVGDEMSVWPLPTNPSQEASQVKFVLTEANGESATFQGSGWGLLCDGRYSYFSYYPFDAGASTFNKTTVKYPVIIKQTANGNADHINPYLWMYAPAITPEDYEEAVFNFYQLGAIMKFVVTVPQEASAAIFKSMKILNMDEICFRETASYNPSTTEANVTPSLTTEIGSAALKFILGNEGFTPTDNKLTVYAIVCPTALEGKTLKCVLADTDNNFYCGSFNCNVNIESAGIYNYDISVGKNVPIAPPSVVNAVDMGTFLMADRNLGAENPEDSGFYFAWGEIVPKQNYSWASYCGDDALYDASAPHSGFIKYYKNTNVLLPEDDPATLYWGDGWRMPTYNELQSIAESAKKRSGEISGVKGMFLTNPKDDSKEIFIPNTGYMNGTTKSSTTTWRLWSSSLVGAPLSAGTTGSSGTAGTSGNFSQRYLGYPVRPIKAKPAAN